MTGKPSGLTETLRPRLGAVAGVLCGLIGTLASLQLPLGTSRLLGPGAVPLLLSLAMTGLSLALFVKPGAEEADADEEDGGLHGAAMVALVALMIGAFALLLTRLGFIVSATALMYGLYAIGEEKLVSAKALLRAVLTALAAYLLFVVALSVNMPAGTLWGY
ncbi:Tripartite tricarboxylate transporter TctB family protein [Bosea sp. CRIB-10]|uniref:tripartite tricarboxylate transporter TctB family protein n=1 Tax=Bosea sp. CRIB-10 TaxID=378404 RepID=UPI0008E6E8E0|nr:tripartite tricarboxylate transporter TctB family protein [Bosea sp. CRIB-10]SFD24479.1 Tripartite tricarboxylate transporter TctB family protein [Bosea sp. CRIB-10]